MLNTEEIYSQISGDNEAFQKNTNLATNDVSFVLARKSTDSNGGSPGKMGLFTIALVMCVCCLTSFFAPGTDGSASNGSSKQVSGMQLKTLTGQIGEEVNL